MLLQKSVMDLDTLAAQKSRPAAIDLRIGIKHTDADPHNTAGSHRAAAGGRLAVMIAGFQSHIHIGTPSPLTGLV